MVRVLCAEHAVKHFIANALLTCAWGLTLHSLPPLSAARSVFRFTHRVWMWCEHGKHLPYWYSKCHHQLKAIEKSIFAKVKYVVSAGRESPTFTIQNMFDIKFINILIIVRIAGNEVCNTMQCTATCTRNEDVMMISFNTCFNRHLTCLWAGTGYSCTASHRTNSTRCVCN